MRNEAMKRFLIVCLLCLVLLPGATQAAQQIFVNPAGATIENVNNGIITTPPQIDTITFVNNGSILINTAPATWYTYDTLNYTNTGIMIGTAGFRFDTVPTGVGSRTIAANFVNLNPG